MKKTYSIIAYSLITALLSCGAVLTSCSSDNDVETPQGEEKPQTDDGRKLRQLTIENVAMTRATLTPGTDNNSKAILNAAWNADDGVSFLNVTAHKENKSGYAIGNYSGLLTASTSGVTSAFTGDVRCTEDDWIAFFYPSNLSTNGKIKKEEYAKEITNNLIIKGDYEGRFLIVLSGQKGTLEDIQENFHYIYGMAQVTKVTESTATAATRAEMKSLLAVCKFTFKDNENNNIPVDKLTITYYDGDAGTVDGYAHLGTVIAKNTIEKERVHNDQTDEYEDVYQYKEANVVATPDGGGYLDKFVEYENGLIVDPTDAISDGIYVALFPVNDPSSVMQFTVESGSDTYMARFTPNLVAGKFYPATLTLTKQ